MRSITAEALLNLSRPLQITVVEVTALSSPRSSGIQQVAV